MNCRAAVKRLLVKAERGIGSWPVATGRCASAQLLDLGSLVLSKFLVVPTKFYKSRAQWSKGNDGLAVKNNKNLVSSAPNNSERRRCCGLRWVFYLRKSLLYGSRTQCTPKLPPKKEGASAAYHEQAP